jgi:hypothetical protein
MYQKRATAKISRATPPTAPPMMGPIGTLLPDGELVLPEAQGKGT